MFILGAHIELRPAEKQVADVAFPILACGYRHATVGIVHQVQDNELESLVKNLDNEEKEFVILGDLNCDLSNQILNKLSENLLQIINLRSCTNLSKNLLE